MPASKVSFCARMYSSHTMQIVACSYDDHYQVVASRCLSGLVGTQSLVFVCGQDPWIERSTFSTTANVVLKHPETTKNCVSSNWQVTPNINQSPVGTIHRDQVLTRLCDRYRVGSYPEAS